ncbi:G-protein beta WD-40 repeats containing protein [Reticulomyxa filosa]|uniref:G-protein beta WD-40 repeats containing protein n=1 Tax=Reticulomyxa filosa TaxID=46433 RepID=X6LKA9_RETFI|nr:G-protein beta WD-40 repeats containing protein [Reticulomyxa filosa]|eukprot:ETO01801.1 G-protein beta WD-40 repeats containing protein [Reticulomyxa filosa]
MILTNLLSIMLCFFLCLFSFNHRQMLEYLFNTIIYCHCLTQTTTVFMIDTFCSSCNVLNTLTGHTNCVYSIDSFTFDGSQFICSGSDDNTVRVWEIETNEQIQLINGHSNTVYYAKFSPYHYYNYRSNVVCFSSDAKDIYFWDIKDNTKLQSFNGHTNSIHEIIFSPFNGGKYLCSGSDDKTICLWDVETSKSLHVFNGHEDGVWCVDISPLQSNNNNNDKSNSIGVIGGNGYTICSGSYDKTIRIWDIETAKQLNVFKGHNSHVKSVKYGSDELVNIILSGSFDTSVRLWDIRSGQQVQIFNGHIRSISAVEYSPFVTDNIEVGGNSNVVCSGSWDQTIRFWDIRFNKNELYALNGESGIMCFKFLQLNKNNYKSENRDCGINLYYGSSNGSIDVWG